MPTRTYMVIDRRHDHSLRIPRPDLSARLGTPNACNDCHADKAADWAAAAVERWHGRDRKGRARHGRFRVKVVVKSDRKPIRRAQRIRIR